MVKVQEVIDSYFYWTNIKRVLTELLSKHPLNSANSASFISNDNSGKPPASAGSSSQSGETMNYNSHSAYRRGHGGRGGRGY